MAVADHSTLVYVEQGGGNLVIEDESGNEVTVITTAGTVTPA